MAHKRNTKGLAKAAKQRRQATIKKVKQAISALIEENKVVNFNIVSKLANVGKPWLYKEKNIRKQIEGLRQQTKLQKNQETEKPQRASDKSKKNIILMLKQRVRELEDDNKKLKGQIEILYGKMCSREN